MPDVNQVILQKTLLVRLVAILRLERLMNLLLLSADNCKRERDIYKCDISNFKSQAEAVI